MLQTFQDHYRDAVETGRESELRFWLGVVGDEGKSLVREQVAALRERKVAMKKAFFITVEGLCATVGGAIGAALRRSDNGNHQIALPTTTPIGFILTISVLSLLLCAGSAEFQSLGGQHHLLTLSELGSSFTSPSGVSWLLRFLVVLAFMLVSARLNHSRSELQVRVD